MLSFIEFISEAKEDDIDYSQHDNKTLTRNFTSLSRAAADLQGKRGQAKQHKAALARHAAIKQELIKRGYKF